MGPPKIRPCSLQRDANMLSHHNDNRNPKMYIMNDMQTPFCQQIGTDQDTTRVIADDNNKYNAAAGLDPAYSTISASTAADHSFRVPCKARGLPSDHNHRTAYIEIPVNAPHGMILMCSHTMCAGTGRKFRYCAVCKVPVAKRNFRKRHAHGLLVPRSVDGLTRDMPHAMQPQQQQHMEYQHQGPHVGGVVVSNDIRESSSGESGGEIKMTVKLLPHEFRWLAVLHNRPKTEDGAAMQKWFQRVLEVSNEAFAYEQQDKGPEEMDCDAQQQQSATFMGQHRFIQTKKSAVVGSLLSLFYGEQRGSTCMIACVRT